MTKSNFPEIDKIFSKYKKDQQLKEKMKIQRSNQKNIGLNIPKEYRIKYT